MRLEIHTIIASVLLRCEEEGVGVMVAATGGVLVGLAVGSKGKLVLCVLVGVGIMLLLGLAPWAWRPDKPANKCIVLVPATGIC